MNESYNCNISKQYMPSLQNVIGIKHKYRPCGCYKKRRIFIIRATDFAEILIGFYLVFQMGESEILYAFAPSIKKSALKILVKI